MKCPECGTQGCYVGFTEIKCKNPKCIHYDGTKELFWDVKIADDGQVTLLIWEHVPVGTLASIRSES